MDLTLLIEMAERLSIAGILAFLLSQTYYFRRLMARLADSSDKIKLTVGFGLIGIVGTYAGIPIDDAIANSRVIGVMAAGLIGGPKMGLGAGLIAGGHRYFMGGFTAFSCALANVCEGLLAGMIYRYTRKSLPSVWIALLSGIVGEIMQMGILLLTARPFAQALTLVEQIAVPMIVSNSIGLAIFILIVRTAVTVERQAGAEQSQKALDIATKTLPYFRRGLDLDSAREVARIVYESGRYAAVGVTDKSRVLAFFGEGKEHHWAEKPVTRATQSVLERGEIYLALSREEIGCQHEDCPLKSAVIVPLLRGREVIGTFKLYYTQIGIAQKPDIIFAQGLAHLFSIQLELAEGERLAKLAEQAELKALQAQINPHFLFNTLNTITSLIRTKPDTARDLLLKLGSIFRFTLQKTGKDITLAEELEQIGAYLAIEKARYGEKLKVTYDIRVSAKKYLIPTLSIQPIVENAVIHGLKPKAEGGTIIVTAYETKEALAVTVKDDGVGMDLAVHHPLQTEENDHIGMKNVHERLVGQYGQGYGLRVVGKIGQGSQITILLPKQTSSKE